MPPLLSAESKPTVTRRLVVAAATALFLSGLVPAGVAAETEAEDARSGEEGVLMAFVEPWTDPSRDMAVTWICDRDALGRLEYRPAGGGTDWQSAESRRSRPFPALDNRHVHTAHLTGLQPETVYEVRWPGASFTETFKTAPASGVKVAFLSDYQNTDFGSGSALEQFGTMVNGQEAHLLVLVGDYVNCDGKVSLPWAQHWYDFLAGLARYHRSKEGAR
jgi:hypothetical protein